MICAAYCRKSSAQDGPDDELSVSRQREQALRYASEHHWTLDEAYVYSDTGVSGAEFAKRPGLMRLIAALKPKAPFDVLIVTDRDRLGREQIETSFVLKQIITAGVRVFEVSRNQEIMLTSPADKVLASVTAFAGELEREQSRVRTHAAMAHRARQGHHTGGIIFGYTSASTPSGHVVRAIVPAEAAVVNRLFELAADGHGVKTIARILNAESALAPRKAGRVAGWSPSTVRGVLQNELYRGVAVWNRTKKRDAWGQRNPSRRDEGDVIRTEVPAARILDETLWQRAHARRDASRALYDAVVGAHGRAGGRPPSGSASRYLLSGLASCAWCTGSMFARSRGRYPARWVCMTRHLRGAAVCSNALEVRLDDADAAVLEAVSSQLLRADVLETALAKALATLESLDEDTAALALSDEAARLEAEVARLADAIARGGDLPALVAGLQAREERRAHVRATLAERERQRGARRAKGDALNLMRTALADWQGLLQQETGPARTALQSLLAARLVFTPEELDGRRFYRFEGPGTVVPIITGIVEAVSKGRGPRTRTIPPALRGRSSIATAGAASLAAGGGSTRGITSGTGRMVGRGRSRTSRCCAGGIIGRCTRRVTRSRGGPTARSSSGGRMDAWCRRCRRLQRCPRNL